MVNSGFLEDKGMEIEQIRERKMREMEDKEKAMRKSGDMIDSPLTITDDTFAEAIKKYPIIVIDCWAPWCSPCRTIAPVLEELAKKYAGRVVFGKLNVDENPRISREYAIMAIPTLIIFKDSAQVGVIQGALPKPDLEARIKEWL